MKFAKTFLTSMMVVALAAFTACGGGGGDDSSAKDGATSDSGKVIDGGKVPDSGTVQQTCTKVASWPAMTPQADFDPTNDYTFIGSVDTQATPYALLTVEDWHTGTETFPRTVTLKTSDHYYGQDANTCTDCVLLDSDCTGANPLTDCAHHYFAQGGSLMVTKADEANPGTMTVSGSDIHVVEWDLSDPMAGGTDKAIAGGKCYDITAFSMTAMWNDAPTPDAGP